MNTLWKVASLSALATIAACGTHTKEVVREQPIVQQQPVVERERVVVMTPPAAPTETIPPAPSPSGYTWVSGFYEFRDSRWVWVPGKWVVGSVRPVPQANSESPPPAPFAGARWVPETKRSSAPTAR